MGGVGGKHDRGAWGTEQRESLKGPGARNSMTCDVPCEIQIKVSVPFKKKRKTQKHCLSRSTVHERPEVTLNPPGILPLTRKGRFSIESFAKTSLWVTKVSLLPYSHSPHRPEWAKCPGCDHPDFIF